MSCYDHRAEEQRGLVNMRGTSVDNNTVNVHLHFHIHTDGSTTPAQIEATVNDVRHQLEDSVDGPSFMDRLARLARGHADQ